MKGGRCRGCNNRAGGSGKPWVTGRVSTTNEEPGSTYRNNGKEDKNEEQNATEMDTTAGRAKKQEAENVDRCGSRRMALGTRQLPIFTFDSSRHKLHRSHRGSTRQPQTSPPKPRGG
ncbi:uncharacterized protein CC84DRAFT_440984 [Paraphaeosphaeria sporulosa]|uniref:Uncharacterized protein n=1 Tax=Paraphaeosphaeria sporulosa TaxID=1460663 RepID=A0A177CQP7_9PLEO|nr:uncharacterized protein CC84DRAFT_440984 [Paraphaeosphaeria sporulosa]OAG09551.1 hypothetical protein CC84DRAFT_440984 [Paraphaeosphaeria sporulosa]